MQNSIPSITFNLPEWFLFMLAILMFIFAVNSVLELIVTYLNYQLKKVKDGKVRRNRVDQETYRRDD